jgi:hypothetical protein
VAWLEAPVVVALLWGLALLALAWSLLPAVGFALGLTRIDAEVIEDPAAPEPRQADPDYGRTLRAFTDMGFRPVGRVIEHARFFSPLQLRWRSQGENWLVSKDGQTFVSIFKPRGRDAWMASVKTSFVGGGYLQTVTSRAGLQVLSGKQWRVEVGDIEPPELIAEHRRNVDEFGRENGVAARAASFRDTVDGMIALERRIFPRLKMAMSTYPLLLMFVAPLYGMIGRGGGATVWFRPLALCFVALIFAGLRWMATPSRVPTFVRAAVMLGVFLIPALIWTRLPHSNRALSAALDRLDDDARAGRSSDLVRIAAVGSRACRQVVGRYAYARTAPETRARLHEVLVKLNGGSDLTSSVTDVHQAAEIWGRWCEAVYSKD